MDERLRFVARLLEGEKMAVLCREFDISRKTDCFGQRLRGVSREDVASASNLPPQQSASPIDLPLN